ncbi:MAG: Molybdopterin-guanine dinucleotide biosynthesis protein MobB, partial [uncultured Craurococcus sp.]
AGDRPRRLERGRQDHADGPSAARAGRPGRQRLDYQACASPLRCRYARQGFLGAPGGRGPAGSHLLREPLGADDGAARRAGAGPPCPARPALAGRPGGGGGLQARPPPEGRGPPRRQRQALAAPGGCGDPRRRQRCAACRRAALGLAGRCRGRGRTGPPACRGAGGMV